jgi:DNA adenine methylase
MVRQITPEEIKELIDWIKAYAREHGHYASESQVLGFEAYIYNPETDELSRSDYVKEGNYFVDKALIEKKIKTEGRLRKVFEELIKKDYKDYFKPVKLDIDEELVERLSNLTGIEIAKDYPLANSFFIENNVLVYYDENYNKYVIGDNLNIMGILQIISKLTPIVSNSIDILAIVGNKKQYLEDIYSAFPDDFDIYIEPFVGGGWVYENKPKFVSVSVLNDINENIYFFFKTLADNPKLCDKVAKRVYSAVQKIPYDDEFEIRDYWDEIKNILTKELDLNDKVDKCAYIFILSRINKGVPSLDERNKKIFVSRIPKTEKYISSLFNKLKEQLENDHKVVVLNVDGIELLKGLKNKEYMKSAFIFLDPPYIDVDIKKYYGIESFDHKALFEVLKDYPAKWLMTINEHPLVYEYFGSKEFKIEEYIEKGKGIAEYQSKCLLVRNYE